MQAITPHDLRHTCASLAISAGVNVLALQRMLGHKSAKVTLDTYADLFDDDLDAVAVTLHAKYSPEIAANQRPLTPGSKRRIAADMRFGRFQLWRWRRDLNPRRAPGQGVETAVTCEMTLDVIRWNSLGLCPSVPKMCPRPKAASGGSQVGALGYTGRVLGSNRPAVLLSGGPNSARGGRF